MKLFHETVVLSRCPTQHYITTTMGINSRGTVSLQESKADRFSTAQEPSDTSQQASVLRYPVY